MWDSANVFPLKNPEMDRIQLCPLLCCSEPLRCFSIEAWAWLLPLRPAQCSSHRLFRQAVIVLKFSKRWGLFLLLASCLSRWEKKPLIYFILLCLLNKLLLKTNLFLDEILSLHGNCAHSADHIFFRGTGTHIYMHAHMCPSCLFVCLSQLLTKEPSAKLVWNLSSTPGWTYTWSFPPFSSLPPSPEL